MPKERSNRLAATVDCDLCHERKGRNATVVHVLKFPSQESLAAHLREVFPNSEYAAEWFLTLYRTAHQIYYDAARQKWCPLWLVYLEAHGVKVNNRAEAIMKFRGHTEAGAP